MFIDTLFIICDEIIKKVKIMIIINRNVLLGIGSINLIFCVLFQLVTLYMLMVVVIIMGRINKQA